MKKTLVLLLSVAAFILGSVMVGTAGEKLRFSVPFPFYAGTELLPAGNYVFEMPDAGSDITTVRKESRIEVDLPQTRTEKELVITPSKLADKDKPLELVSRNAR
jgi:hypothetical protein